MTEPSWSSWPALFDLYPAPARPIIPHVERLGNAGGLSGARLFRFRSARGPMVARLWPEDGPGVDRIVQVHAWMNRASHLDFVPQPLPTIDGRTTVKLGDQVWEITPWLPGSADPGRPPSPAHLWAMFERLADYLSSMDLDRSEGLSPGLAERVRQLDRWLRDDFADLGVRLRSCPTDPAASIARAWLDLARGRAPSLLASTRRASRRPLPLQPCLRDARPDHFLFEGDRLTGLVDFGAMSRDSVAGDLARLLSEGVGPSPEARAQAIAAFEGIRPLADREILAIESFGAANAVLGGGRWARWHFLEGRTFGDPGAVLRGLTRGLERLQEST